MSNYDKTDQHRYPFAQTRADRWRWWSKVWPKLVGAVVGLAIGGLMVFLMIAIHRDDLRTEHQNQVNRQYWHEVGIADCKKEHGIIQLDRLGWYVGCLVNTEPKGVK